MLGNFAKDGFRPTTELAGPAYREIEEASKHNGPVVGLDTRFIDLNRMTGSFHTQNFHKSLDEGELEGHIWGVGFIGDEPGFEFKILVLRSCPSSREPRYGSPSYSGIPT